MKKSKGHRTNTRNLLTKNLSERGTNGLRRILYNYKIGENVVVQLNASVHKGMPHRRYQGKIGIIVNTRGRAYVLDVTQGKAIKEIFVRPDHLKPHIGG